METKEQSPTEKGNLKRFFLCSLLLHLLVLLLLGNFVWQRRALNGSDHSSGYVLIDEIRQVSSLKSSPLSTLFSKSKETTSGKPSFSHEGEISDPGPEKSLASTNLPAVMPSGRLAGAAGEVVDDRLLRIRRRLEDSKVYPTFAIRRGVSGTNRVRFRIDENGKTIDAQVVESSGSKLLDEATLKTLKRAEPLPMVSGWLTFPLRYELLAENRP